MDTWVVHFLDLRKNAAINICRIFVYKSLCGYLFPFLLGISLGEELLGHMAAPMFNLLKNSCIVF
jgi:hypothetical protein